METLMVLSVSSWICQIIVAGHHDAQIPRSPDEIETLEIQNLMLSLLKIEENEFERRIACFTWKRLCVESKSWSARAEIGTRPLLPSLSASLLAQPQREYLCSPDTTQGG